jgi:hypothetical protein
VFPFGRDLLAIYLQDHLAGATGGVELVRRAAGQNAGTELGDFLSRLAIEIDEDRDELRQIMRRLDVGEDRLKVAGGWAGEKLGRLKLNGRIREYSPLSRVLELEALIAAVNGKLAGWRSLGELAATEPRLDLEQLERLALRAGDQIRELVEHHAREAPGALRQD